MFKKRSFKKKLVSLLALSFVFLLATTQVPSVNTEDTDTKKSSKTSWRGMIVSPAVLEIYPYPGDSVTEVYKIENDTPDHIYQGQVIVQTFMAGAEEGKPEFVDFNEANDYQNEWVTIEDFDSMPGNDNIYQLAPGKSKEFKVTFSIPENVQPGGYYFSLAFETAEFEDVDSGAGAATRERIGVLAFVDVRGDADRKSSFESFEVRRAVREDNGFFKSKGDINIEKTFKKDAPWAYDKYFDDIAIKYKIKADGKSFINPGGNIFFGDEEDSDKIVKINPDGKIVMPGQPRTFYVTENNSTDVRFFDKVLVIDKFPEKTFGTQTITAKILYLGIDGTTWHSTETTFDVFFFPWKTLLIVLAITIIIVGGYYIYMLISNNKNQEGKKQKEENPNRKKSQN